MPVWLLHHQSCILCFITFFTKHGVANASNESFPKWQNSFYFWNQFRILVYSNLQKSPPCKLKSPQIWQITKSPPWRIKSPLVTISPTLNNTGLHVSNALVAKTSEWSCRLSKLASGCSCKFSKLHTVIPFEQDFFECFCSANLHMQPVYFFDL